MKDYNSGFSWGKRIIKCNYRDEGDVGLHKADKAAQTCMKYATDKRITKTKTGKVLTDELRSVYRGIADGILHGYNNL